MTLEPFDCWSLRDNTQRGVCCTGEGGRVEGDTVVTTFASLKCLLVWGASDKNVNREVSGWLSQLM